MKRLVYYVTEEEINTAKWYWKVLQPMAGVRSTNESYKMFTYYCRKLRKEFKAGEIAIEQFNDYLYDLLTQVKKEFPEDFHEDKLGWWSNERIVSLIKEGRVAIDGKIIETGED